MSVDHCPTCPDCGDDLVFEPPCGIIFEKTELPEADWRCPECGKTFDFPDWSSEQDRMEKE